MGIDQELFKVPLDPLQAHDAGFLLLQPSPEGILFAVAVDVDLSQHGESDAVIDGAEGLDLFVGAGLLAAELVAGKRQDGEGVGWIA